MPELGEYLRIKAAAAYLGVCRETLRNWEASGKIAVHRHPMNNYRLYKKSDLDKLVRQIEASGVFPTGWKRVAQRNRKPR
jgi:DNA (cytosine-5)-methyltransferase 1